MAALEVRQNNDFIARRLVAHALHCYPVSFAGTNPALTARSYRALLKEIDRPLGLFPEGVHGTAHQTADPLPGVERLLLLMARNNWPVIPCRIGENESRLQVRFREILQPAELLRAGENAARVVMDRIKT